MDGYQTVRLDCAGQADPHAHVGAVSKAIVPVLRATAPDLVVVQGDTSSALGGALAANMAGAALAHVEAGLRSHDRRRPWPEEEFRIAIDRDSDLLFAPTELSVANLRRERVSGAIHVTGNSGIDAALAVRRGLDARARQAGPTLLVTCHRRENWGRGIGGIASALRAIAAEGLARVAVILHPNPDLSRHIRNLLSDEAHIALREPCPHSAMIEAMVACDLVLSDSGGIQEEAAAFGVPLLVLREKTERPEGIACGTLELVGTDPDCIIRAVRRRLCTNSRTIEALPFGDGRAGERIARIIDEWLSAKRELSPGCSDAPRTAALSPKRSTCPRHVEFW